MARDDNNNDEFLEDISEKLFTNEWHDKVSNVISKALEILDKKIGAGKYDATKIVEDIIDYNVNKRLSDYTEDMIQEIPLPEVLDWRKSSYEEVFEDFRCLVDAFQMKIDVKLHKLIVIYGKNNMALRHYQILKECVNSEYENISLSERKLENNRILVTFRKKSNDKKSSKNK
jgi:hypothetical protein